MTKLNSNPASYFLKCGRALVSRMQDSLRTGSGPALCCRDPFMVSIILVGCLGGKINPVFFPWPVLRNALPGNMGFNLCCLPLKMLS